MWIGTGTHRAAGALIDSVVEQAPVDPGVGNSRAYCLYRASVVIATRNISRTILPRRTQRTVHGGDTRQGACSPAEPNANAGTSSICFGKHFTAHNSHPTDVAKVHSADPGSRVGPSGNHPTVQHGEVVHLTKQTCLSGSEAGISTLSRRGEVTVNNGGRAKLAAEGLAGNNTTLGLGGSGLHLTAGGAEMPEYALNFTAAKPGMGTLTAAADLTVTYGNSLAQTAALAGNHAHRSTIAITACCRAVYVNLADSVMVALLSATDNPGRCPWTTGGDMATIDEDALNAAHTIHLTGDHSGRMVTVDPHQPDAGCERYQTGV